MRRVILLAEAREDALEAFRWYENERPDLGKVFRAALNDTIRRVRSSPLASVIVYRDLRRALVHRFPYAVFYRVQPDVLLSSGSFMGTDILANGSGEPEQPNKALVHDGRFARRQSGKAFGGRGGRPSSIR